MIQHYNISKYLAPLFITSITWCACITNIIFMLQLRYASKLNKKPFLSLEEFVFRQKVLLTYRLVMRIIYKHHEKQDLARFARDEFKINKDDKDLTHRKYLLHLGINRINDMAKVFGLNTKL